VYVYAEAIDPFPEHFTVQTRVAPWHSDGTLFELTGAKALSYGFNLAATVAARRSGFDDALLVGESGNVLEGPTFSIAWVHGGVVRTPGLELGILESITRQAVLDACGRAGVSVVAGAYPLSDLMAADEVVMMSTLRQVMSVAAVDDRVFPAGPVTAGVAALFESLVAEETA
jgi:branched-chain amino acid aminotransferase